MEGTPHTMMVGEGAERLALEDPPLQLVSIMVTLAVRMVMMVSIDFDGWGKLLVLKYYQQAGRADLVTKAGEEEWER